MGQLMRRDPQTQNFGAASIAILDKFSSAGLHHGFEAIARFEFPIDVMDVVAQGAGRNLQFTRDARGAFARSEQSQDLPFLFGKGRYRRRGSAVLRE